METRDAALKRFSKIAHAVAKTAERLSTCRAESGCEPADWPGSPRTLALSALTVALHESGLREDVQFGHPPLGRGPAGEVCLVQVALDQAPLYAGWLPRDVREAIAKSPTRREKLAQSLLGDSPRALERCFEVGMRMLARSRNACGRAGVSWDYGMFSMYGGGKSCRLPAVGQSRSRTYQRLSSAKPTLATDIAKLLE